MYSYSTIVCIKNIKIFFYTFIFYGKNTKDNEFDSCKLTSFSDIVYIQETLVTLTHSG